MAAPRLRKVYTEREYNDLTDDYITQGYEVLNRGQNTTLFRKKTWGTAGGHIFWFLLTVWFTLGFGNLAYALIAHYCAEQLLLKKVEPEEA